jgi:CheY-like chemotaxis protein
MDCQMPEMDGYEATRQIRHHEESTGQERTPIVAVTANATCDDRDACIAAGMDDFLAKPFDLEQLQAILAKWTQRQTSPV